MEEVLQELIAIAGRHAHGRRTRTAIPRVSIGRSEIATPPLPELCQPTALFVLQGTKTVLIGDRTLRYGAGSYFVYAVETPATSQLIEASSARPYVAVAFALDIELIATLIVDHKPALDGDSFVTDRADDELLDAWRRMLRLLDRPVEIPVLAPMLEREIAFPPVAGSARREASPSRARRPLVTDPPRHRLDTIALQRAYRRDGIGRTRAYEQRLVSPPLQGGNRHEPDPVSEAGPSAGGASFADR